MMLEFAHVTGLSPPTSSPERYLWTDAFAVCNFLHLYRTSKAAADRRLALDLVAQVHSTLGKHRKDDARTGWISGLVGSEAARHPTFGGLRIGKKLRERGEDECFDERLEWDRDGQYYHYLTKWMHALHLTSAITDDVDCHLWACELAAITHKAFIHQVAGSKRLYWKMSIDLSYPLVSSMGHHDPLDGFITYRELQHTTNYRRFAVPAASLEMEISDLAAMCRDGTWATGDSLSLGSLLFDACRFLQLLDDNRGRADQNLLVKMLDGAILGLKSYAFRTSLQGPAESRLAFRELGLAIGLQAIPKMCRLLQTKSCIAERDLMARLDELSSFVPLAKTIEAFWLKPANQQVSSWQAHKAINMIMLATSLAPDTFLSV